jgi:glycosyltransferase involved in cell wall biosynthesis
MKILMVISQFYPLIGGAEKQAQLLAKTLTKKGMDVTVVTGRWSTETSRDEIVDGISVHRNFCGWGKAGPKKHRTTRLFWGMLYVFSLGCYLLARGHEYDIIHVHQFLYPAFVSVMIGKRILKRPVVVKSSSSGSTSDIHLLRKVPFGHYQLNYLVKNLDSLVGVSHATGRDFVEAGYLKSRIFNIPNGVDIPVESVSASQPPTKILSISRLSPEKGIDVLLSAWSRIAQRYPEMRLTIIGDGSIKSELSTLSQSMGIEDSVHFQGMTDNVKVFWGQANLFILPSRSEGMSNALLEAMSYGLPCIATNVGGNGELLGFEGEVPMGSYAMGRNGLLVNPEDGEGLSEAIVRFVQDRDLREEMGRRSRLVVLENYSIDSIAEKYITLYQKLTGKNP